MRKKNSCEKTQWPKLWQKLKTQILTKLENLNCDKTQFMTKLKNFKNSISNRKLTENIPNWAYYPQLGIPIRQFGVISNCGLGIYKPCNKLQFLTKNCLVGTTSHLDNRWNIKGV